MPYLGRCLERPAQLELTGVIALPVVAELAVVWVDWLWPDRAALPPDSVKPLVCTRVQANPAKGSSVLAAVSGSA